MRHDANLKYLYHGEQREGKGRKKKFAGKVDVKNIDKSLWSLCLENDEIIAYEQILYCVTLKRVAKIVYMEFKDTDRYAILLSTDTELSGAKVIEYYQLRFQIEFLIRDAKQHTGLEECQARSEIKFYNHFNMSMMAVSSMLEYRCYGCLIYTEVLLYDMQINKPLTICFVSGLFILICSI